MSVTHWSLSLRWCRSAVLRVRSGKDCMSTFAHTTAARACSPSLPPCVRAVRSHLKIMSLPLRDTHGSLSAKRCTLRDQLSEAVRATSQSGIPCIYGVRSDATSRDQLSEAVRVLPTHGLILLGLLRCTRLLFGSVFLSFRCLWTLSPCVFLILW